jgi:sialic acid synthase SpsE
MKKGEILNENDVYYARPENITSGVVDIKDLQFYIGMKFVSDVPSDFALRREFFIQN